MNVRAFLESSIKRGIIALAPLLCILLGSFFLDTSIFIKAIIAVTSLTLFALTSWRFVLDTVEKELITSAARGLASINKKEV